MVSYSTQEIKGNELVKAREPNAVNGLVGKIAGLTVGPSAEMPGRPELLLRGSRIDLYVIDGVPINSDTWNLSPDDIESYTVLNQPTYLHSFLLIQTLLLNRLNNIFLPAVIPIFSDHLNSKVLNIIKVKGCS
jgi:hypothetical protein